MLFVSCFSFRLSMLVTELSIEDILVLLRLTYGIDNTDAINSFVLHKCRIRKSIGITIDLHLFNNTAAPFFVTT